MNALHTGSCLLRAPFHTVAALALLLLAGCGGCKSTPSASPQDDAALTQAVQTRLSSDTSLASEPIQTSVQQGVATLNGTVSSDAARTLASNDAAQISGIKTVVNNLTVHPVSASASSPHHPPLKTRGQGRRDKPTAGIEKQQPSSLSDSENRPAPIERADAEPSQVAAPPQPAAPAGPRTITLPPDTIVPVRMNQTLDSASTQSGETFNGTLASDIIVDGLIVLPQGTPVSGRVDTVREAAHFKGNSLLTIELTSIDRGGDHLPITTNAFSKAGNGRGKNSAEKIGGGAAVGAILGGIFGGGKGAAIGAAAGGGAGAGVQGITRGKQVQIPAESLVRFHLTGSLRVRVSNDDQPHEDNLQRHD